MSERADLTIVVPAWNEEKNLSLLLPLLKEEMEALGVRGEIIVADHEAVDGTADLCRREDVQLLLVSQRGYGRALLEAFAAARGEFVLTMDADLSHPSEFVRVLWERRGSADMLIASRYVEGGSADMPLTRRVLSGLLNRTFSWVLNVPVKDLSSGFRLYRKSVLDGMTIVGRDFNVLQEILIRAVTLGYRVTEVPFSYQRRESGSSHARLAAFAVQYLKTLGAMWRLRNSIESGDYDRRAFDSRIPLQRWWQRKRHGTILGWSGKGGPALDVGCGSSRILDDLPAGSMGVDPSIAKLRWARRNGRPVVVGALPHLPVVGGRFSTVVCSQVIEHIPDSDELFLELRRLLVPGGILILGTPDYGRLTWKVIEAVYRRLVPGGYADGHMTRYRCADLVARLENAGFAVLEKAYVGGAELILRCRRRD